MAISPWVLFFFISAVACIKDAVATCLDPSVSIANRQHVTLKIGRRSTLTHQLASSVAEIILKEMLGYTVETVDIATSSFWGPDITGGLYDIDLENWEVDPLGERYREYITEGLDVVDAGVLGYSGRSGLYTFSKLLDKDPNADYYKFIQNATAASLAGLRTFAESSLGNFLASSSLSAAETCNVQDFSWCGTGDLEGYWAPPSCAQDPSSCIEIVKSTPDFEEGYLEQIVKNNQVQAVVGYYGSDIDAVHAHIRSMQSQSRTPLFYWWEPTALLLQVDAVRISFPDFSYGCDRLNTRNPDTGKVECDSGEAIIHKLVSRRLRDSAKEAFYSLSRIQFSSDEIRDLLRSTQAAGGAHATAADAACAFVRTSPKIQSWAPKCLTHPGFRHPDGQIEAFSPFTEVCENRTDFPRVAGTYCFPEGTRPGTVDRSDVTIRIVLKYWATHHLSGTIAEALLRDYLGYNVEMVSNTVTGGSSWAPEVSTRMYDFDPESWQVKWGTDVYRNYVDTGLVHVGLLGVSGRSGILIRTSALSRDPMADYWKFYESAAEAVAAGFSTLNQSLVKEALGDAYPSCTTSWCQGDPVGTMIPPACADDPGRCIEILHVSPLYDPGYIEQLITNLGLEAVVSYTTAATHWDIIDLYEQRGLSVPFYWWVPDASNYRVNSSRISFPDYTLGCDLSLVRDPSGPITCDFEEQNLAKKIGSAFLRNQKEAWYALSRMQITGADMDELLPLHVDAGGSMSAFQLACEFVHRNTERIKEWVPDCISNPPPRGEANINDTIFSLEEEECVVMTCPRNQVLEYQEVVDAYACRECGSAAQVPDAEQKECIFCNEGEAVNGDQTSCEKCPPGFSALPRSATCTACAPGTFANSSGQSSCDPCPLGKAQSLSGQDRCLDCPLGEAASKEGLEECEPCSPGSAAPRRGLAACELCLPGTHQDESGASQCEQCTQGRYASESGALFCLRCLPGYFQPNKSSPYPCERCPFGFFAETEAASACEACTLGTTFLDGADSRDQCQCPENTFLLEPNNNTKECVACNEYMIPCEGGDNPPMQREGYFVTVDAQDVYRCRSEDACPGGLIGTCPVGSSGRGCAECVDGEYYWDGEKCEKCAAGEIIFVVLFPLTCIVILACIHWFGNDPISHSFSAVSEFLVVVGLTLNIFLYLNSLAAFEVDWKEPVDWVMQTVQALTIEFMNLHVSCSVTMGNVESYFFTSLIPLAGSLVCILLAVVRFVQPKAMFNTWCTCIYGVFLLFLLHALKPFRYIVHPDGDRSVLDFPTVFEGTDEHVGLVAVGLAVLLGYCVPFAAACVWAAICIIKARHSTSRRWYLVTFRFLFYKFRPEAYYWGICILFRNVAFAVAPSISPEVPKVGVFMLTFVSSVSAAHTAFVCPWRFMWMNVVDASILCYVLLILNLAAGWVEQSKNLDGLLATTMLVAGGAAAGLGFCCTMWLLLRILCASKEKRASMREESMRADEIHRQSMLMFLNEEDEPDVAEVLDSLSKAEPVQAISAPDMPPFAWVTQQETDLKMLYSMAKSIREKDYHLLAFYDDCMEVFPELQLFAGVQSHESEGSMARRTLTATLHNGSAGKEKVVGGFTGFEEQQRTIGALFAVYCLCRLDIDGKEIMSFGVDENKKHKANGPPSDVDADTLKMMPWGKMQPDERRAYYFWHFNWELMEKLLVQSGILKYEEGKGLVVDASEDGRLVAMLSLTAYHDIMKDRSLCPTVSIEPYGGVAVGEKIEDHDLALAYLLDRYPTVLPSFRILQEEQRRIVRFTQSEMGFNAGWLVQAEGPPSAVLGKLKKAIANGGALNCDVAFYFVHWVTDLAGAEPTPFRGSEKFAIKFPPAILQGLLSCFSVVETLASRTETEVYEKYIHQRWQDRLDDLGDLPASPERVARMRLHCMAQQHARPILEAFDRLPEVSKETLIRELAVTGLHGQEFQDWSNGGPDVGTPFLMYYGPAWCQRVGGVHPDFGLSVMADIFRLGRAAYPESLHVEKDQQAGITYRTLEVGALKTIELEAFKAVYDETGLNCLTVKAHSRTEGVLDIQVADV